MQKNILFTTTIQAGYNNPKNLAEEFNRIYYFEDIEQAMNLEQVIFLTTSTTKSASEAVINSISADKDVIIIISPKIAVGLKLENNKMEKAANSGMAS